MKFSTTALALATMAGSAFAGEETLTFETPIAFTQYSDSCEGDVLYDGEVLSIKKMAFGKFCLADNIMAEDGSKTVAYSMVNVVSCEHDAIYENWLKCSDEDCNDCEGEYEAYTTWDNINPLAGLSHCYDYHFSTDPVAKTVRDAKGIFKNTVAIYFHFDEEADEDDVSAYNKLWDSNSCIVNGQPAAPAASVDEEPVTEMGDVSEETETEVSGASGLATTAAFAAAGVAALFL